MDDAIAELDNMGSMVSSYKIHLNVCHSIFLVCLLIERTPGCQRRHRLYPGTRSWSPGANSEPARSPERARGAPCMSKTPRECVTLLTGNVQQTVQVDSSSLLALTQESLEQTWSIKNLETSVTVLYKALLAGRDRGKCCRDEKLGTSELNFC